MELVAILLGIIIDARKIDTVLDGQIASLCIRVDNHLQVVVTCFLKE